MLTGEQLLSSAATLARWSKATGHMIRYVGGYLELRLRWSGCRQQNPLAQNLAQFGWRISGHMYHSHVACLYFETSQEPRQCRHGEMAESGHLTNNSE